MSDGKVVIETDLDSSGIEKGLSKLNSLTVKGLKAATVAITGTATAMGGIATAAVKVGSGFEAQMSRVKAISGATGEEFEKLRKQAIKLGADTAFSSREAAEGMENLAAAGFSTSEIMDAMPGLLDLAAASGEDLANSSEIAASTLRGFGLEAADAAHVADVLAANAYKTNSSVAETGEAMKYVAPLARAAGLSMEETAAAIGIMANAGIQGSQAGTTLRGALSRLSKPTDDMTAAMEELGISFYDSNGKMKSLSEQVGMMQKAMSGMTDEQKNNYLVTLYGQEALSGMLALINEGEGELTSLTNAYKTCDGAAKEAASTMQDNLKGAVEQLKGSAESLGIVFYEDVADGMKEAAQAATESINNITDAFNSGGLDAAIEAAGDEFANLSVEAASHAPEMVETAVDFIESFAQGISKNKRRLIGTAGDMAETLASGLAELLPDELQKPVEEAIDSISDSLNSGGLKKAGKSVENTFENIIDVVGNLAGAALPPLTKALDFAGDNLDTIAASATAAFVAFKGYKVISETTSVLSQGAKAWKTASAAVDAYNVIQLACTAQGVVSNATLTAGQAAVGLLTGRISLATAAQTAWNAVMTANPIGLVITAVGALTAGLAVYALTQKDVESAQEKLNDSVDRAGESFEAVGDSINTFSEGIQNAGSIFDDFNDSIIVSNDVQQEMASKMDAVQEEITQIAKTATEERRSLTETEIQRLDQLFQQMNELTAQELSVQQSYATAVRDSAQSLAATYDGNAQEYANASQKIINSAYETKDKVINKAYEQMLETNAINQQLVGTSAQYTQEWYQNEAAAAQSRYQQAVDAANKECGDTLAIIQQGYSDRATAGMEYLTRVSESNAQAEQEKQRHEETLKALEETYAAHENDTKTLREVAEAQYRANVAEENKKYKETMAGIWDSITKDMDNEQLEQAGIWLSMVAQTAMSGGALSEEAKRTAGSFIDSISEMPKETRKKFESTVEGALEGLEGFDEIQDKAEEEGISFLEALAEVLEVNSPSKAVKRIFVSVNEGAEAGLDENKESLFEKGKSVISGFLQSLGENELIQNVHDTGVKIMNFFGIGIESQKGNIDAKSKAVADSSNQQLGSADTQGTGVRKSSEYNIGVGSNKENIDTTSKTIADSSNEILGSADTQGTGSRKTKEYDTGVGSNKGNIDKTSRNIADSSNTILGSKDTKGTGSRKGSEYNAGLGSNKGNIDNTSSLLANSSNDWLGSADTSGTGRRKGAEYDGGLGSNSGAINATSRSLSNTANSGMGTADTEATGRRKSNEYDEGLGSADTYHTGKDRAEEGKRGLESVNARNSGYNFVQGFVNGFGLVDVWDAAWRIGKSALSALSAAIEEGSPSRLTKLSGKFFGQGFGLGIKGEEKNVAKISKNLGKIALESLDTQKVTTKMKEAMALNTGRVVQSFSIESDYRNNHTDIKLSEEDITRLGKIFGIVAADRFADNMGDTKIMLNNRELGRTIREVSKQ